ncbi:uncharacterized protein LOC128391879 [Panonychus citri]|uniref:uncharacterized protein LOC128391879 n=1 Tax=Panonychus citri TaxID=50023 RepID=UPI002308277E|nr:uncharacterized protein LOC128391879 [Panonychus citri]
MKDQQSRTSKDQKREQPKTHKVDLRFTPLRNACRDAKRQLIATTKKRIKQLSDMKKTCNNPASQTRFEKQRKSLSEFIWMVKSLDSETLIRFGLKNKAVQLKAILASEAQRDLKTRALARVCNKSCMSIALRTFKKQIKENQLSKKTSKNK